MNLKTYREQSGFSLVQLEELLGVTKTTLLRWEAGEHRIPAYIIPRIQTVYKLTQREVMALLRDAASKAV